MHHVERCCFIAGCQNNAPLIPWLTQVHKLANQWYGYGKTLQPLALILFYFFMI